MPRRFEVVLFDLGSTLLYFDGSRQAALAQADVCLFQELVGSGCLLDPADFIPAFRGSLQAYFRQREIDLVEQPVERILQVTLAGYGYPNLSQEIVRRALRKMYAVTESYWKCETDTLPVLARLKQLGYRLGLISNAADAEDVRCMLAQHQLEPYFEQVLISAELGLRKPHPAVFRQALDFFRVQSGQAVMVGDTLDADILGARNSGLASVWITRRVQRPDNRMLQDSHQPDAIIETLADLPAVFEHWQ